MPGQLPLPDRPPPFACTPNTLGPRDTLRLRMAVPHGGQLAVTTPSGRSLVVVPFAPATALRSQRFEYLARVTLAAPDWRGRRDGQGEPEPVFSDSGVYTLMVSELAEIGASLVCRVRYRGG